MTPIISVIQSMEPKFEFFDAGFMLSVLLDFLEARVEMEQVCNCKSSVIKNLNNNYT